MKGQLTQALANEQKPRGRDFFVWDSTLPGFGLKVTPAGNRIYIFQYRLGGRSEPTKRITIGKESDGYTESMARLRASVLAEAAAAGRDPRLCGSHSPAPLGSAATKTGPAETWQIRLGFLAGDMARLQNTFLRRSLKQLRASRAQWGMLGQLALHQGVTQMELAKILGLSKVAVTGLVNRVVRAGWVERRLDERDKRVRRLFLTREAKKAVAAMREEVDAMNARSMGHISDAEGEAVVAVLEGIKARLLQLGRGSRHRSTTGLSPSDDAPSAV